MIAERSRQLRERPTLPGPHALLWRVSLLVLVISIGSANVAQGIDPLPPEIERASPAQQKAYITRAANDSWRERTLVAQRRHDERQQTKQALVTSIQHRAKARQREILKEVSPQTTPTGQLSPDRDSLLVVLTVVGLLGIAAGLGALALSRNTGASWFDRDVVLKPRLVTLAELRKIARKMPETGTPMDLEALVEAAAGDPEMMKEVLDVYIRQTTERIAGIRAAIEAASPSVVKGLARDCLSTSILCGMTQIVPLFREFARVSEDCHMADLLVLLDRVEIEFRRITCCLGPSPAANDSTPAAEPQPEPQLQSAQNRSPLESLQFKTLGG